MELLDLRTNPFAVLGLTPRDGPDAIARAVEARLADPVADEHRARQAQQTLMAPRPRLQAELGWLVGLSPGRAHALLTALSRQDLEALTSALPDAPPLARANLAAHLAHHGPSEAILRILIEAYDEIAQEELTAVINAERAVGRLPRVAPDLVEEVLGALRERHLDAAQAAIVADPHPGRLMTRVVEEWIDAEGPARDFLEALTERYDRWSAPVLGRIEERLDAAADRLRADPKLGEALEEIVCALVEWDEYSQSRQLLFRQKRLDEPRSRKLADKLRSLGVWLANERQEYQRALVITKALLVTFPELPGVDAKLRKDVSALQELVRQSEEMELLAGLTRAVETARACPSLSREIEHGDFGREGAGVAGRLYAAFARAARRAVGHEHADLPWHALRQLAIELHNEHKETEAALRLIIALRSFTEPQPSPEIADRLRQDEATVRGELLWCDVRSLIEARRWKVALERLGGLEALPADAIERQKIAALRQDIRRRRSGTVKRRMAWAVVAAFLGVIWLANLDSRPPAPRAASSTATTTSGGGAETAPPVGRDRRLTRDQIRYCLFQGERLEAFRLDATTSAQIARFNRLVDDWNSRCSSYRYYLADRRAIEWELGTQRARLLREGEALAAAGRTVATPAERWWGDDPVVAPDRANLRTGAGAVERDASGHEFATGPSGTAPAPPERVRLLSPASFPADAEEVQRRLAALGLYTSAIDGIWGAASRSALIEFKRAAGLPANADWDRATQTHLFQAPDR